MSDNKSKQIEEINWDGVNEGAQDAVSLQLPLVIWRHGKKELRQLGEKAFGYLGGLFFSYEAAGADTEIEYWHPASFEGDKDEVQGLAASEAVITLVRMRRRWFRKDSVTGKTEFRAWNSYEQGFRGHQQFVGFIRGYDSPVTFSFKGLLGQSVEAIQREHVSKVVSLVNRTAPKGKSLPPYALWMQIKSGKHEQVGQGNQSSWVTMPEIVLPKTVDVAFARSRFIGNELLGRAQDLYLEAATWANEWRYDGGAPNPKQLAYEMQHPDGPPSHDEPPDYASAGDDSDGIPF